MEESKRTIPVPVEKALKSFYSFLTSAKEDLVAGSVGSRSKNDQNAQIREKRNKMLEQLKSIVEVLPKHMNIENLTNSREQELVELVISSEDDISRDYMAAQGRWVDLLLDKVSDILDSTQYVNLERLTQLMEKNDDAGCAMEGKDVILLMGSPGSGKTTTLHYLAGTTFREITRDGLSYFKPIDVVDSDLVNMKVSCGGKDVITRHLQVVNVEVDDENVVLCDSPSFGDHESIEEVIANSLGLVRALQKAKSVRPILVLSRDEIGVRGQFNAYPQILSILVRMLGTDSNVNLDPFNYVFTKYDTKNIDSLRKQLTMFLKEGDDSKRGGKTEANKQAIIKHLIAHTSPDANIIVPTKGDPIDFLRRLLTDDSVVDCPEQFFFPNLSDSILSTMKKQLKFTLLDLREALSKNNNSTGIHRMQQMSKLANLLPEAGIYARHGFKAFKEIINQMVEEDEDEYEYYDDMDDRDEHSFGSGSQELKFTDSRESWNSSESERWSNVSPKVFKSNSNDNMLVSHHLTTVPEEVEEAEQERCSDKGGYGGAGSCNSPINVPNSPINACNSPIDARDSPTQARNSPISKPPSPVNTRKCKSPSPIDARKSPMNARSSPMNVRNSPYETVGVHPIIYGSGISPMGRDAPDPFSHDQMAGPSQSFMELAAQCEQAQSRRDPSPAGRDPSPEGNGAMPDRGDMPVTSSDELVSSSEEEEEEPVEISEDDDSLEVVEDQHDLLPEEEQAYAEQYSTLLKEMTIKAVEEEDYVLAVQRMQEFMRLAKSSPQHIQGHSQFKHCVELFLVFHVALKESDYHKCLSQLEQLISMGESDIAEAKKCAECGVNAAVKHIVELREQVVAMTSQLHVIDDPDEFDRASENLRLLRRKVEMSNMLMEACMRGSNERGKSETVLACLSYGFKVGRLAR